MSRTILVELTTDHDDSLAALQSVIGNLSRAGYVTSNQTVHAAGEAPMQSYEFNTYHAKIKASEIDLHMERTREEARDEQDDREA